MHGQKIDAACRQVRTPVAILQFVEAAQNVELSQDHLAEAVDLNSITQHDRIEPTAAARTPGRRAEFVPEILARSAQTIAKLA